jgi:hypothetical protein
MLANGVDAMDWSTLACVSDGTVLPETCHIHHYYDEVEFKCLECDSNCAKCTGAEAEKCETCYEGYFKKEAGGCEKCGDNVIECTDKENISKCEAGYYLDTEKVSCESCPDDSLCSEKGKVNSCKATFFKKADGEDFKCATCLEYGVR